MAGAPAEESTLRAKYLDWCSARVADHFLRLTPDQIYELAQQATGETSPGGGERSAASPEDPATTGAVGKSPTALAVFPNSLTAEVAASSYRVLVERVTEVLAARMGLPTFEEWKSAYREDPKQFEDELMGFWKEKE